MTNVGLIFEYKMTLIAIDKSGQKAVFEDQAGNSITISIGQTIQVQGPVTVEVIQ